METLNVLTHGLKAGLDSHLVLSHTAVLMDIPIIIVDRRHHQALSKKLKGLTYYTSNMLCFQDLSRA